MNNGNIEYNIITDLEKITALSSSSISSLFSKIEDIICHDVYENKLSYEEVCNIDIGIGYLQIYIDSENIKYRFSPSSSLEKKIINAVNNNNDILITNIEESLRSKIINNYKDLF